MQRQGSIVASLIAAISLLIQSATVAAEAARVEPNDVLFYPVVRKNLDKENILWMLGDQEEVAYVGAFAAASQGEQGAKILAEYCETEPVNLSAIFEGIARAGSNASATLPTVVKYLGHEKQKIREGALLAITAIRSPCIEAIEPLKMLAVNSEDIAERISALRALGIAAHGRSDTAGWLIKTIKESPELVEAGIGALGSIGPAAKESVPLLIDYVKSKKYIGNAVFALGEIGKDAQDAIQVLLPLMKEESQSLGACIALNRIGDTSPELIAALTAALRDKSATVQIKALTELAVLGPLAKQAVPLIKPLLYHQNPEIRVYAAIAYQKIDGINEQQIKTMCDVIEIALMNEVNNVFNNFAAQYPALIFLAANSAAANTSQEVLSKVIANSEKHGWNEFASYAALTLLRLDKLNESSKTALRDYSVMEHTDPGLRMRIQAHLQPE